MSEVVARSFKGWLFDMRYNALRHLQGNYSRTWGVGQPIVRVIAAMGMRRRRCRHCRHQYTVYLGVARLLTITGIARIPILTGIAATILVIVGATILVTIV